ncbi:MAG: exodeoxyribonuclease VII large subunit [Myxococcota bacterium]
MKTVTVSALVSQLDRLMARAFPRVAVEGELSQLSTPMSGHAYLTLRHGEAVLPCVVWKSEWARTPKKPKVGDRIVAMGRLGIYTTQGKYQLYANRIEPAGQGEHERKLQAIRARLERDGLTDPRRKRPLPRFPSIVGLATSPTGAALQDFLAVSAERWPATRIHLAGCKVQGPEAAASVVLALETLFEDGRADVIVVTRGGGSKDDLLPFQDEQLARFIASSPIPMVSAVGHEIDTTMADLTADAVAPTPSAAAALVLPDCRTFTQRIDDATLALAGRWERLVGQARRRVTDLTRRLKHPARQVEAARNRHRDLTERLDRAIQRRVTRSTERLQAQRDRLVALSPTAVLARGYAIAHGPNGVLRSVEDVAPGANIEIQLSDGRLPATVSED